MYVCDAMLSYYEHTPNLIKTNPLQIRQKQ